MWTRDIEHNTRKSADRKFLSMYSITNTRVLVHIDFGFALKEHDAFACIAKAMVLRQ